MNLLHVSLDPPSFSLIRAIDTENDLGGWSPNQHPNISETAYFLQIPPIKPGQEILKPFPPNGRPGISLFSNYSLSLPIQEKLYELFSRPSEGGGLFDYLGCLGGPAGSVRFSEISRLLAILFLAQNASAGREVSFFRRSSSSRVGWYY